MATKTTITIEIDDKLRFALSMAKSCYLHQQVLDCNLDDHPYRIANYDRLNDLYIRFTAALREATDEFAAFEAAALAPVEF